MARCKAPQGNPTERTVSYVRRDSRSGNAADGRSWTGSSVALAHHNVVRSKNRDDVGDHVPPRHVVERAHVDEGRRADLQAVGLALAVTDDVEAQLALVGFGTAVDLPLGHREAHGKE